jgi:hypothetical protein
LPIAPDGYFCLEDAKGKMYWFLEADRYTMDHRRFYDKMSAYYHWWEGKRHVDKFGINNFRVLTICQDRQRRDRRLDVTKGVKKAVIDGRETAVGIKLFWFTAENDYSLEKPQSILKPILKTAKEREEHNHSLLE